MDYFYVYNDSICSSHVSGVSPWQTIYFFLMDCMSHLDLLLVHLENEYFWEKFQSHYRMIGEKLHHVFLLLCILVFFLFDKIQRQVKCGRWSDILLISIPEYDLEGFSDNLQEAWSITEPVSCWSDMALHFGIETLSSKLVKLTLYFIRVFTSNKFMLKSPVNMHASFPVIVYILLDLFAGWNYILCNLIIYLFIYLFLFLFIYSIFFFFWGGGEGGGSKDVANCNFLICVFMEYNYKGTFPNIWLFI